MADRPCVGSGYCCKERPCFFGEAAPGSSACIFLEPWPDSELKSPRYRCGRYDFIRTQPGAEASPAFGSGCSSPLFNTARDAILIELRLRR